ncbi:MAG: Sec-independent protein translocase protein TatB [Beijerinckiaceae bacterium]
MFEFDASKLIIIGIVALIVIGPKELPRVMRQVGLAVGKMRKLAGEFQSQFMEAMREADVAEIKAEAEKLANQAKIDVAFNPMAQVKAELSEAVRGFGEALPERLPPAETSNNLTPEAPTNVHGPSEPMAVLPAGEVAPAVEKPAEAGRAAQAVPSESLPHEAPASEALAPKPLAPLPIEPAAPEHVPLRTSA